jgi:hypothetical protein
MKHIVLFVAAGALIVGCSDENSDSANRIKAHPGYTMNEPAGGSTRSNNPSGSTINGKEGGSASAMSGQEPSGSRSPGPAGDTKTNSAHHH